MSRPHVVAARVFPHPTHTDRISREAVQGLARAREWAGLAEVVLDGALETVWVDLAKLRSPCDFDQLSARECGRALENASWLFGKAAEQCVDVWIALAQLRDYAEEARRLKAVTSHG